MEWGQKSVENLGDIFTKKYLQMRGVVGPTDRRNFSAIWNKYLREKYGASVVFNFNEKDGKCHSAHTLHRILNLINYSNGSVADAVVIPNPDRAGQFIIFSREMASRIIVLGML